MSNSYDELLSRPEWKAKRLEILTRDNNTCQSCGKHFPDGNGLQAHHLYYRSSWLPWAYPNDALITWCQTCHHERHRLHWDIVKAIGRLSIAKFYKLIDFLFGEVE